MGKKSVVSLALKFSRSVESIAAKAANDAVQDWLDNPCEETRRVCMDAAGTASCAASCAAWAAANAAVNAAYWAYYAVGWAIKADSSLDIKEELIKLFE